jgi:hypothetical protein
MAKAVCRTWYFSFNLFGEFNEAKGKLDTEVVNQHFQQDKIAPAASHP